MKQVRPWLELPLRMYKGFLWVKNGQGGKIVDCSVSPKGKLFMHIFLWGYCRWWMVVIANELKSKSWFSLICFRCSTIVLHWPQKNHPFINHVCVWHSPPCTTTQALRRSHISSPSTHQCRDKKTKEPETGFQLKTYNLCNFKSKPTFYLYHRKPPQV